MTGKRILYDSVEYADLRAMLDATIAQYPENYAFVVKNKHDKTMYTYISYKQFGEEINALGTALFASGLNGKRVAVIGKNRYEWILSYLAIVNGVGTVVPLDKGLQEEELFSLICRSGCETVIFSDELNDTVSKIRDEMQCPCKRFICMDRAEGFEYLGDVIGHGKELLGQGDTRFVDAKIDPDETKMIIFTSGTTSASKAVMLSHRNIASNIYGMRRTEKFYSDDVNMAFLPFHHTFGATAILLFLSYGMQNVFCDGLRYVAKNLAEYKVTVFVCVPLIIEGMYKKIIRTAKKEGKLGKLKFGLKLSHVLRFFGIDITKKLFADVHKALGGHVRFIISGASAIDKEVPRAFNDFGILTVQGYGLTEAAPVLASENIKSIKSGSVGMPLCNIDIKIVDPDENGIGEITASGPNIMAGYYKNDDATQEVLRGGRLYTGDLGYIDKDGFLFVTGRKKNVIVLKNGKNVFPEELEALICKLPYVTECMVFGYPKDDDLITTAKIVYDEELLSSLSAQEKESLAARDIEKINNSVAKHQRIRKIMLSTEPMEKTTTAKIKRFEEIKKILA